MQHAEMLTDRILFLEGAAQLPAAVPAAHRPDDPEQFESDMADRARGGRAAAPRHPYMRSIGDITSANIFEEILADEEQHIDYLETQLELIDKLGEQLYLGAAGRAAQQLTRLSCPTLLLGHSLGMHRRLIHRTFECPKPVERTLVWLGVLVGMAGPLGIFWIHDIRDCDREPECHDFFAHRRNIWVDALWQLHCSFRFRIPPRFVIEPELARDPWYRFMDMTLHQFVLGAVLYAIGGLDSGRVGSVCESCGERDEPLG